MFTNVCVHQHTACCICLQKNIAPGPDNFSNLRARETEIVWRSRGKYLAFARENRNGFWTDIVGSL